MQFEFDSMADVETVTEVIAPLLQPQIPVAAKAGPDTQAGLKQSLLQTDRSELVRCSTASRSASCESGVFALHLT